MKTGAKIANPDMAIMELTVSMPVGEWKMVQAQLDAAKAWPAWKLRDYIRQSINALLTQIETHYEGKE